MHKDIQSAMQEDRGFPPSAEFRKQAVLKAPAHERMYDKAAAGAVAQKGAVPMKRRALAKVATRPKKRTARTTAAK